MNEIAGQASSVSLHRRKIRERSARNRGSEAQRRGAKTAKVVHSPVIHGENCGQRKIIHVSAKFHVVAADGPGEIVRKLIALLDSLNVGVRLATKIGETRNVYSRVGASGNLGVVEVGESAPRILKAEFIDFVIADAPRVLKYAGDVAISLLRGA